MANTSTLRYRYVLSGALKWPFWDKMSHFVQTFVWRNGWVSGLLWDIDGFVMKFLAMPRRSERRYLPRLGVQNGNLPQNGCGEKKRTACHTSASAAAYTYALTSCTNVLPRRRASVDACRVRASSTRARAQITTAPRRAVRLATRGARAGAVLYTVVLPVQLLVGE